MEYNFREIEKKWQKRWVEEKTYQVTEDDSKQKFYVLNMFPYPSGAGLHVGHPLGYIASDIYARYKRLQGFNVLNPMGYDAYGLPAEQYAIQTGQHPAITTVNNINRYREQLDKIGFSFDWNREIRTCDPEYYHWTQWAFQKMFNSYYCNDEQQARPIEELEKAFAIYGNKGLNAACSEEISFTAEEWNAKSEKEKQEILMNYRIAYLGETMVNWCAELGTVLANDEVVDGVSERGGFPVIQKKMRQWCLRVSAYAQRLLDGLDTIEWTDSLKETQRNWIGRSEGAEVQFKVKDSDLDFYKHEDNIPVTLHIGIQKNVNAQIEYIEAENDAEKYLMLGLIVGRNDKNVEYVTVDPQLELPEVFLQMAGDVKKKDRFSDVPKQKKLQDVSVKKENALREKMPEKHQKMKDADKISEKKDVISEQQEGQENTASDPTDFKKDQSVINREYDEMIKNKTLEEDYMDVLEYLGLKKEMLTGEFPERIIAQNIVNIYSDNTDSEKIRKAL